MIKRIRIEDETFQFTLHDQNLTIINQQEFSKLHSKIEKKVRSTAHSYMKFGVPCYDAKDIEQELLELLPKAIANYDSDKQTKFMTYFWQMCYYRIIRLIKDNHLHIPMKYLDHPTRGDWSKNVSALLNAVSLSDTLNDSSDYDGGNSELNTQIGVKPDHVIINDVISEHILKPLGF